MNREEVDCLYCGESWTMLVHPDLDDPILFCDSGCAEYYVADNADITTDLEISF